MKIALLVTAVMALALGLSLRESTAASPTLWLGIGVPYAVLGVLALARLHRDGTLGTTMRPRAGDFSLGFLMAGLLFGGAWLIRTWLFAEGSLRMVWVLRIAVEVGSLRPTPGLLAVIVGVASLEELAWRGLVLSALTDSIGSRRAWPVTAAFYALAHVPTVFTLADPAAGLNPLLVVAALGCGIVWSFAASILGRLPPVIISHAVFSYFAATVLLPRFG
jgi:membrane protease YdiL (CAAX protease family)